MTGSDAPPPKSPKDAQNAAREARLAKALRENLKRRKEQVRGKAEARDRPPGAEPAESDENG